jgi:dGTPase
MDWETLLSPERFRKSSTPDSKDRTQFQRDYDRIIFSKPFRRLQKKTQVFPLPEHDFIHTRLTHSLETSCIGRSLGMAAGQAIRQNYSYIDNSTIKDYDFAAVVAAAALAHDLGNPPFGHSGEDAIGDFFKGEGKKFIQDLPQQQQMDFTKFEGNAMGFRLMAKTLPGVSKVDGGINLTYATLGAFAKYPKEVTKEKLDGASGKKYSFFNSEKTLFVELAKHIGLLERSDAGGCTAFYRHPLAFLVEAADDISYSLMDLEDGCNIKLIDNKKAQTLMRGLIHEKRDSVIDKIIDPREKVAYLRALAISSLVTQVTDVFIRKLPDIMAGSFDKPLASEIKTAEQLKKVVKVCKEDVYTYRKVLEIESAGFEVISGLLSEFLHAITEDTEKAKKIRQLLPKHYIAKGCSKEMQKYETIMHVVQFVAGMTDTFAIDTYRSIKGIRLPNY